MYALPARPHPVWEGASCDTATIALLPIREIRAQNKQQILVGNFVCALFFVFTVLGLGESQKHWEEAHFPHARCFFSPSLPTP